MQLLKVKKNVVSKFQNEWDSNSLEIGKCSKCTDVPFVTKLGSPQIDKHINEARLWATYLAHQNIPFFCPHMNSSHMEVLAPEAPPEFWYEMDYLFLDQASVLLLIPGWEKSKGALAEKARAQNLGGIPCYTYERFDELVAYWHANTNIGG